MLPKERIIAESTRLFIEHGVKAVRMDDIALNLSISKRTLYEIFGDRKALILQCLEYFHDVHSCKIMEKYKKANNIVEEFLILIDNWEDMIQVNVNMMNDLRRFYPELYRKVMQDRYEIGIANLKQRLHAGVDSGIFLPDLNCDFAAAVLTDNINNVFLSKTSYVTNNISMAEAFKYITIFFFRGISTPKGMKIVDQLVHQKYVADKKAH